MDLDGNGKVSYQEFFTSAIKIEPDNLTDRLFNLIDQDG